MIKIICHPWFNANNICEILEYKDKRDAIRQHVNKTDSEQFKNLNIPKIKYKIQPQTKYINEHGLYSLLFTSKTKIGKLFKNWIIYDVIPKIRKNGIYAIKNKYENKLKKINDELFELKKNYSDISNMIKNEKYPSGGIIYVAETNNNDVYKIGITDNLNDRKNTYNTGTLNNIKIIYYKKINCPKQLELCVKSILYKYRYANNREFYKCKIDKIKKCIKECIKVINKCDSQTGGNYLPVENIFENKIFKYNETIIFYE